MSSGSELLRRALELQQGGNAAAAAELYRRILADDPDNANALHLLGVAVHQTGDSSQAVELIGRAIRLRPREAAFYNNLGVAYRSLRQFEPAMAAYRQALALNPDFAEAVNNLGTAYQELGHLNDALAEYERAIALRSDYANAHYNRGRTLLTLGRFSEGWEEYEWRWLTPDFGREPLPKATWDGSSLAGRTLLIWAEQGLGDTLQFIRYRSMIDDSQGRVILQVQKPLLPLLSESGFTDVFAPVQPIPKFDVDVPLLSLPRCFATILSTIPSIVPYLRASARLVEHWRNELTSVGGFKVGLQWQAGPNPRQPGRGIPLAQLEPLSRVPGVKLISLQHGHGIEEIESAGERLGLITLGSELDTTSGAFMDTAAIVKNLDLVITCDTALAHLAGGLAVPVWTLLPKSSDWRWLADRDDTPWYPTMRLFRQSRLDDWSDVVDRVTRELTSVVNQRK